MKLTLKLTEKLRHCKENEPFGLKDVSLALLPTASLVPFKSCLQVNVATGQHFSDDVAAWECTAQISLQRVCCEEHG